MSEELVDHIHAGAVRYAPRGTTSRVLVVGEDNPYGAQPEFALYPLPTGCAGNRLCRDIFALRQVTYLGLWRTNLCVGGWSSKAAVERAEILYQTYLGPWLNIIMLGRKVASAFAKVVGGTALRPFDSSKHVVSFSEYAGAVRTLVSLPHPSGRNLIWNADTVRSHARMFLTREVPDVPWGEALNDPR